MIIQHHRTTVFMHITVIIAHKKQEFFLFIHVFPNNIYLVFGGKKLCFIPIVRCFSVFTKSFLLSLSQMLLLLFIVIIVVSMYKYRFISLNSNVTRVFQRLLFIVLLQIVYVFFSPYSLPRKSTTKLRIKGRWQKSDEHEWFHPHTKNYSIAIAILLNNIANRPLWIRFNWYYQPERIYTYQYQSSNE